VRCDSATIYIRLIIALALVFDSLNGLHDAANSIATVVSTRALTPWFAVLWAWLFNFIAVFMLGVAVAKMVGKGIMVTEAVNNNVLPAALTGILTIPASAFVAAITCLIASRLLPE